MIPQRLTLEDMMTDYSFLEKYDDLRETLGRMIRADKQGMLGEDAWLPADGGDITHISEAGDNLHIAGSTWTMQTGGSNEHWEIDVPKEDIALFRLREKLKAASTS